MKNTLLATTLLLATALFAHSGEVTHDHNLVDTLKLENILNSPIAASENLEIIVSRVSIPPHTALPKHWHPGEEFAYVIDGSVTLWQKGKPDTNFTTGEVAKVPLKQTHTAMTGDEGVVLLVFRIHEKGQPERVPAE